MSTNNVTSTTIAKSVRQKIQIPYSYVAGPAVSRFLAGLKEGVIYASVCPDCGRRAVPPLSFCGHCWKSITEFVAVGPRGVLESFAAAPRAELPGVASPVTYGLVRLEGADSLLAHVVTGGDLRVGAAVEAVWRPERQGSITDIGYFRAIV